MKKLYIALTLIAVCLSLCTYEQLTVSKMHSDMTAYINEALGHLEARQYDEVNKDCEVMTDYWRRVYPRLNTMVEQNAFDDANVKINTLCDLAESRSPLLYQSLINARSLIDTLWENQRIAYDNIF
jgi:hypothetical protein